MKRVIAFAAIIMVMFGLCVNTLNSIGMAVQFGSLFCGMGILWKIFSPMNQEQVEKFFFLPKGYCNE